MDPIHIDFTIPDLSLFIGFGVLVFAITTYLAISHHREKLKRFTNPLQWLAENYLWIVLPLGTFAIGFAVYEWIWQILPKVGQIITKLTPATQEPEAIRSLAYAIGALLAAVALSATIPFQLIKVWVNERLAKTTEQGHMTDRITKAVEQLGAEKTIWVDGDQQSVPNLEVRLGGIYALERIAQDSMRDHIPVMEILCAYVRNNSPASDRMQSPHEVYEFLAAGQEDEPPLDVEEIYADRRYIEVNPFKWVPLELDDEKMRLWAKSLPETRSDIQAVLTVIGRRREKQRATEQYNSFVLDLKKSNLQKALLTKSFDCADFDGSHLDGAELVGSFNRIKASVTTWQGARARAASLSKSVFLGANLNYAYFGGADLQSSDMRFTKVKKTNFNAADVRFCDWFEAKISDVFFYENADASWGRFHRCSTQNMNGINEGSSNYLFAVDEMARENIAPDRLIKEVNALDNEVDARNAWLKTKAAANL